MNRRVNITKRVKVNGSDRYCPVVEAANGRIRADWVTVDGREEHHPEGAYSIDWTVDGKRRRLSVGTDAADAYARKLAEEARLNARANGVSVVLSEAEIKGTLNAAILKLDALVKGLVVAVVPVRRPAPMSDPSVPRLTAKRKALLLTTQEKETIDLYWHFVSAAAKRKIESTITLAEFINFTRHSECHYCCSPIYWSYRADGSKSTASNLDRMDSSRGYSLDNVVPCCQTCNMAKGARDYLDYMDRTAPLRIQRVSEKVAA